MFHTPIHVRWSLLWLCLCVAFQTTYVQAQFSFTTNNGTITITQYTGTNGNVVIPSATNGYPVVNIAAAFAFNSFLTNVLIPNSVTNIGNSAFYACPNLTSLVIPDSVTTIGTAALYYGYSLANVTIPNSVTTIGENAFFDCSNLTSLNIPSSVTNIGAGAFENCSGLEKIYFHGSASTIGGSNATGASSPFWRDFNATFYYFPSNTGWGATYAGLPTVLWNPQAQTDDGSFGVRSNSFGFNITGTCNLTIVVEATPGLVNPVWTALSTNTLTSGSSYFSDTNWTNFPSRLYRIRSP